MEPVLSEMFLTLNKKYWTILNVMMTLPVYDTEFFRVADPTEPKFPISDLYSLVPFNQKRSYKHA
jgi:acetyl-CoA carboxylase carboxyltransferase component